tara:strand:+ start:1071 stop:1889 length:819 start_codon:yes stop_codon:yes gene_type:complete
VIKKLLLLFIFICSSSLVAQKDNFWLLGKLKDSSGVVKNANIINLKTNKGTYSNDFGDYKIIVSIGDTLQFTSVQHRTVYRIINNFVYRSEVLDVFMIDNTYQLDEVVLKRNDLDGFLTLDLKKTPEDRKGEALKRTMNFSKVNMKVIYDGDFIDQNVKPPINNVDPTSYFAGAGSGVVIPFGYSERLWSLRRDLEFKKNFPKMLVSEFGEQFFKNDLKIPTGKYYAFLEYCNPLGIEDMYRQNRKIELINVLREESPDYLKLLNKEEEDKE